MLNIKTKGEIFMFNLCAQTSYYGSSNSSDVQLIIDLIEMLLSVGVIFIIISIALTILSLVMAYNIAVKKGRSGINWILLTLVFGWIAVVIVSVSEPLYNASNTISNSSGYSLTKSATATRVNTVNQNYAKPATTQQKPGWTCACGQVNNPNAMRCINCGEERRIGN